MPDIIVFLNGSVYVLFNIGKLVGGFSSKILEITSQFLSNTVNKMQDYFGLRFACITMDAKQVV